MTGDSVYSVALNILNPASLSLQRSVLASVPGRFRVVDEQRTDVLVVSGENPDWPDVVDAAADGGVQGVVVVDPGFVDPDRVRKLADAVRGRMAVAVQTAFANDSAWQSIRHGIKRTAETSSLLDSLATVPAAATNDDLMCAVVGQVAIVRPLLEPLARLRLLHRGECSYLLSGETSHPRVTLSGVRSAAGCHGLTLDVVAPDSRWEIRFDATALGAPTTISHHMASGTVIQPLVHESGRRVTWQRLYNALKGDGPVGYNLHDLAADLGLVEEALHEQPQRVDSQRDQTEEQR